MIPLFGFPAARLGRATEARPRTLEAHTSSVPSASAPIAEPVSSTAWEPFFCPIRRLKMPEFPRYKEIFNPLNIKEPRMTDGLPTFDPEIVDNNHHNTGDDGEMQIDPEVSLGGDEDGHPEGMDAEHPANPATYPIPPKPVLTETVKLGLEERAEKGRLLGEELKAIKELEARRAKINADITARRKQVDLLTIAVTTGTIEVPVGQEDIFRQPVGREAAASAFDEMAQEAAQAAGEDPQGLNAMAEGIQAAQGIEAPGPGFQNDIEDFKAKTAAKRKGKR